MLLGSKMDKILCSDQKWFDRLVYWGKGQNMCLFLRALKSMQSAIFELLANHIYKYTLSIIFKTLSVVEGLTRADHLGSRYKAKMQQLRVHHRCCRTNRDTTGCNPPVWFSTCVAISILCLNFKVKSQSLKFKA